MTYSIIIWTMHSLALNLYCICSRIMDIPMGTNCATRVVDRFYFVMREYVRPITDL